MELERSDGEGNSLRVGWMALALVIAAFTGAALGLVWQSAGFGDEPVPAGEAGAPEAEEANG